MTSPSVAPTMEPLSARIPSDLYLWLAQLQVDGAATNSDKLRVLLAELKRQHDGTLDYVAAHAWARGLLSRIHENLVRAESRLGRQSEVLNLLLDHLTSMLALVVSQAPRQDEEITAFEDALVRRSFALCETLLRQGATPQAAAFDPAVVRRHAGETIEMLRQLQVLKGTRDV